MKKLVFLYLLAISTVCCLYSCKEGNEKSADEQELSTDVVKNPASALGEGEKLDGDLPEFTFAKDTFVFGKIMEGEKVTHEFEFENTGKSDLIISDASASCGCTVPEYSKEPVSPGKKGVIKVIFNSEGKEGTQNKTVTIVANTIPNTKMLTLKGEVIKK